MKLTLNIQGESKKIYILPENNSDKKILEFVAEHDKALLAVKRDYGGRNIEYINVNLLAAEEEVESLEDKEPEQDPKLAIQERTINRISDVMKRSTSASYSITLESIDKILQEHDDMIAKYK